MNQLLPVLAFVLCISMAFALRCNVCTSLTSLADCDKNKKVVDCGVSLDRCATLAVSYTVGQVSVKSFARTCNTKAYCNDDASALQQCKNGGGECKLDCCNNDLCNAEAPPGTSAPKTVDTTTVDTTTAMKDAAGHSAVSVLLMVACAIGAFIR